MKMDTIDAFETEWENVRLKVLAFCRRSVYNFSDAEDIFQQVAIRAWRGFKSFRHDASFLTWTLTIARREVARFYRKISFHNEMSNSNYKVVEEQPDYLAETVDEDKSIQLVNCIKSAGEIGILSQIEVDVMMARISLQDLSWDQVGLTLDLKGNFCAVTHCRAIPKFRVFLFIHGKHVLGGEKAIIDAFSATLSDQFSSITKEEEKVFRQVVLEKRIKYSKSGWRQTLRIACSKVIKRLPVQ